MSNIQDYIEEGRETREEYLQVVRTMLDEHTLGAPDSYHGYGYTLMNTTIARWKPWDMKPEYYNYDSALKEQALFNIEQMNDFAPDGLGYELGVYNGGVSRMLLDFGRDMVCFDTFTGIKGSEGIDDLENGEYCTNDESAVRILLNDAEIVKGDVCDTLKQRDEPVAFVHMDMDVYVPTYYALNQIWPRLVDGGVIMMDDYGVWCTQGVMRAVDVFLNTNKARVIYFPTGQMAIIK